MVFGDLSKISLGAAAGVVAERGGYVSALSDKARASGFDAAGDLLAAPPPALASVAASATSFADPSEFAFPTTLPELQDRVVAGLSAARELMREYLPAELAALGGAAAPSPANAATAATAATAAIGSSLATATKASTKASTADASSLLVPLCFLAGAGTAAAVYYYGPERCRLAMDAATAKTKRALEARWKRVKAFLGPGFDDALVRATALVVAAKAAVAALPSHPRVVAWRDAAETFARETAAPKARDLYAEVASAAFAGIELAEEGAKAVVKKSVDVAKPALAKTLELAKPHWEKAVAALRPKIEAAIEYLERAFSALGGEK